MLYFMFPIGKDLGTSSIQIVHLIVCLYVHTLP